MICIDGGLMHAQQEPVYVCGRGRWALEEADGWKRTMKEKKEEYTPHTNTHTHTHTLTHKHTEKEVSEHPLPLVFR